MPRNRIIAILIVATSALCLAVGASAKEPDYPCYMTTRTGRVLNLGSLCGDGTAPAVAVQSREKPSKSRQKAVIEFAVLKIYRTGSEIRASGQVSNLSDKTIVLSEIGGLSRDSIPVSIGFVTEVIESGDTFTFQDAIALAAADVDGALKDVIYWTDGAGKHYDGFTVCSAAASVACRSH